jgi:parvulin-like peptidyl-prolyl isomerase
MNAPSTRPCTRSRKLPHMLWLCLLGAATLDALGADAAKPAAATAAAAQTPTPAVAAPAAPQAARPASPLLGAPTPSAASAATTAAPAPATPFAIVGDTVISGAEYQRALAAAMRKKYYHAKPPEAEVAVFRREVGDDVVNRVLLLAEARRRGIQPDRDKINATIAGYDRQYAGSESWKTGRERMLAQVVPQLESESLLERIERLVRTVPEPADDVARAYYEQHKDLFVEPEQVKLSVILLRVDPSSSNAVWASAKAEAEKLHKKLLAGASFAELAKLHSGDRSAGRGGEMDYTHRGMLPEAVQGIVDKLTVGATAEPAKLLEGYAILRLDGRKVAEQRAFEQVRARAGDLWQRAEGDKRWKQLIQTLRQATPVRIDESHYAPLRGSSDKPRAG